MGIILELSPDTEARLIAQAAARGLSVEELLKVTIDTFLAASDVLSVEALSPQERADRFVSWARKHKLEIPPFPMRPLVEKLSIASEKIASDNTWSILMYCCEVSK